MLKNHNKKIITVVLTIFIFVFLAIFVINAKTVDAQGTVETLIGEIEAVVSKEYKIGDKITLPTSQSENITCSKIVYSPSGSGNVADNIVFTESGNWSIVYRINNLDYNYTIFVHEQLYLINGSKSLAKIGLPSDFTRYQGSDEKGVYLKIYSGESITYNKTIDISSKTRDDSIVSFSVLPEIAGKVDAENIILMLTDAHDSSNYVEIMLKKFTNEVNLWYETVAYSKAGATGQEGQGLEKHPSGSYEYEGDLYVQHVGFDSNVFGTAVKFSMSANPNASSNVDENIVGVQECILSIDYATKRVYLNNTMLVDLDDPALQSVIWDGFTTGECYISFSATNYNSVACNLFINEIDGSRLFDTEFLTYEEKPTFKFFDVDPNAIKNIEINKEVTIPTVKSFDMVGKELPVNVNVYTAYGTGSESIVKLNNNAFIPNQLRKYYVVYKSIDSTGNIGEEVLVLEAKNHVEDVSLALSNFSTEGVIGTEVNLAIPTVTNYIGYYNVSVDVILGEITTNISKYNNYNPATSLKFRPFDAGDCTVKYTYSDMYNKNKVVTYKLSVSADGEALIYEEAVLPKYIILNAQYDIPKISGYTFDNGHTQIEEADLYVTTDGNISGKTPIADYNFKWTTATDKLYFTYVLGQSKKEYVVTVVDVDYGKTTQSLEKYFVGYIGTPIRNKNMGIEFDVENNSGEYSLGFANAVQTYEFAFGYRIPQEANYKGISLYLEDTNNSSNILKITYYNVNGVPYFKLNDGTGRQLSAKFNDAIILKYYSTNKTIEFSSGQTSNVVTNYYGDSWQGFSSQKAWVKVVLEEVQGNSNLVIEKINNQQFYDYTKFSSVNEEPEVFQKGISGNRSINTTVTIPEVYFGDVLAVKSMLKLVVYNADGDYAQSVDGVLLDGKENPYQNYAILLNSYGNYVVSYKVTDELGGFNDYLEYVLTVVDDVAPTVVIKDYVSGVKVESKIKIANYDYFDDVSLKYNCTVKIFIERPDMLMYDYADVSVKNGEYFIMKGKYKVYIFVSDESNNVTIATYTVYVS